MTLGAYAACYVAAAVEFTGLMWDLLSTVPGALIVDG